MRTQTGNQKGFSLIELMVVVGIIGILAAIAVPNYQRFQAKSRQTEAKANLSGLYTAEKAFYAEWNLFFGDFRHIGFAPEGNLRYRVGFSAAGNAVPPNTGYTGPGCTTNPMASCPATQYNSQTYCVMPTTQASYCRENTLFANFALPTATVGGGNQTFTAAAVGNIDADTGAGNVDTWTINQQKLLINTVSDIAN